MSAFSPLAPHLLLPAVAHAHPDGHIFKDPISKSGILHVKKQWISAFVFFERGVSHLWFTPQMEWSVDWDLGTALWSLSVVYCVPSLLWVFSGQNPPREALLGSSQVLRAALLLYLQWDMGTLGHHLNPPAGCAGHCAGSGALGTSTRQCLRVLRTYIHLLPAPSCLALSLCPRSFAAGEQAEMAGGQRTEVHGKQGVWDTPRMGICRLWRGSHSRCHLGVLRVSVFFPVCWCPAAKHSALYGLNA